MGDGNAKCDVVAVDSKTSNGLGDYAQTYRMGERGKSRLPKAESVLVHVEG